MTKISFILFLIGWYYICFITFIDKDHSLEDSPILRTRLGTILWHSSDLNGKTGEAVYDPDSQAHIYCYYPKNEAEYERRGEYIIKRVENISSCRNWYGAAIFHEESWVSEREKIWWSKNQKLLENLVATKSNRII